MRDYFRGRTWDQNNEFRLKQKLVLNSSKMFPQSPYVFDDEREVQASRTAQGRGDLVFTDGAIIMLWLRSSGLTWRA